MAELKTKYLGIDVKNPLVVGACSLTADMDAIKRLEEAGAGAIVCKSLFEEQIKLQRYVMEEDLHSHDDWHAEMTTIFPELKHAGPDEHLMWVQKSKEAAGIPVIGSLNAVSKDTWVEYAKKMADTGVDGLELNFFYTPLDFDKDAKAVEDEQVAVVKEVKSSVSVPVSVKLSQFYTNPLQLIKRMNDAGADGFVLFNRMFHPSIDVAKEETDTPFNLSGQNDHRLAARFVGLLHDRVNATLIASHGIHSGTDAVEVLLSGAHGFQVVSTLYKNSINYIGTILDDISSWMDKKGYAGISDFCGKLSAEKTDEKWTYKRAQYAKMLLHSEDYLKRPNLI